MDNFTTKLQLVKTIEEKNTELFKQVKQIQKEQKKYNDFVKKQTTDKYIFIETQSCSTI